MITEREREREIMATLLGLFCCCLCSKWNSMFIIIMDMTVARIELDDGTFEKKRSKNATTTTTRSIWTMITSLLSYYNCVYYLFLVAILVIIILCSLLLSYAINAIFIIIIIMFRFSETKRKRYSRENEWMMAIWLI